MKKKIRFANFINLLMAKPTWNLEKRITLSQMLTMHKRRPKMITHTFMADVLRISGRQLTAEIKRGTPPTGGSYDAEYAQQVKQRSRPE